MTCPYYKTLIFSHRGRCKSLGNKVDNTLGALSQLQHAGVRGVEIDLWLLKDNSTVIFHDEKFTLTGEKRETASSVLREIEFSKTSERLPGRKTGQWQKWKRPPTVEELISSFPQFYYNFELKFNHSTELTEREKLWIKYILGLLELTESSDQIIFSSFNWDAVDFLIDTTDVRGGYLFDKDLWANARDRGIERGVFSLHPHFSILTKERLEEAWSFNLKVIPWTVNEEKIIRQFFKWGVDGIITDYPIVASHIREELCKTGLDMSY